MSSAADRLNAKHEKALRELLKLPGNKRCVTCVGPGSLAPQYACVTFGTFLCTTCSGVHREFQFRVKSISGSYFTADEVAMLSRCGNDYARARYLAGWTGTDMERRFPIVMNTKMRQLKDFVRAVFHEKKFENEGAAPPPQSQSQSQAQSQSQSQSQPQSQSQS
jgi:hypothetical protein